MNNTKKGFATRQIHSGKLNIPGISPLAMPIFQTSTFVFDNVEQGSKRFATEEEGYIYSRLGNPNANQLAIKLADLENGEMALVTASGMGAITTVFWTILSAGDHVLADEMLYGCTYAFLKHGLTRFGVDVTFVDFTDFELVKKSLRENTKIVYFETPCNPDLKIIDIENISQIVHTYDNEIKVIVDNTFLTPFLQQPLNLGANVVVHSATKYLNGHSDVLAGVIVGKKDFITECALFGLKDMTGAIIGPFEAYLVQRGMKTLDMRMKRHSKSAQIIAEWLEGRNEIKRVLYPGLESHPEHKLAIKQMKMFGGIITFELNGTRENAEKFIDSLELCTLAVSLGGAESLIEHPASMTHSPYTEDELSSIGLSPTMIRLSVGLEDPEDIIEDFEKAFRKINM